MIKIDMWYNDNYEKATKVDCFFNDLECNYSGNIYINDKYVGDYIADSLQEVENKFNFLTKKGNKNNEE